VPLLLFLGLFFYDAFFEKKVWHIPKRALAASIILCTAFISLNLFA